MLVGKHEKVNINVSPEEEEILELVISTYAERKRQEEVFHDLWRPGIIEQHDYCIRKTEEFAKYRAKRMVSSTIKRGRAAWQAAYIQTYGVVWKGELWGRCPIPSESTFCKMFKYAKISREEALKKGPLHRWYDNRNKDPKGEKDPPAVKALVENKKNTRRRLARDLVESRKEKSRFESMKICDAILYVDRKMAAYDELNHRFREQDESERDWR